MTLNRLIPRLDVWLLVAIFLVLSASTIIWTLTDKTPPVWDPADHISAGYDYYRFLAHLDLKGFANEFFAEPHYYAPFVHLVAAAVFLLSGASRVTGIGANLISLAVLLASVTWIGRMLYPGRGPSTESRRPVALSVLAALLAACYHFNAWLLHDAFLDFPLTAIVTLSFALLIHADDFRIRRNAVLFGAAAGVGLLTKQTYAFFFLLPALYVLARVLGTRDRKAFLNLCLAALIALAIAAIWYAPHLGEVIEIYTVNRQAAVNENEAPLFSFESNLFYWHALVSTQMQVPFGVVFACGLIYSLARRRKESLILYLWLISGLAAFTLVANKDLRYTVPVLPAAALISVSWLSAPAKKESQAADALDPRPFRARPERIASYFKYSLVAAIAVWAFVSFFNAQWPRDGSGYYIDTPRFRWMVFARNYFGLDHRPLPHDWAVPGIVEAVTAHHEANSQPGSAMPTLGVVVNLPHLNPSSVGLYARLLTKQRAGPPLLAVDYLVGDSAKDRIAQCQYLLVRTGLDRAGWVAPVERYAEEVIRSDPGRFIPVARFPIPLEQAEAVVYRCGR